MRGCLEEVAPSSKNEDSHGGDGAEVVWRREQPAGGETGQWGKGTTGPPGRAWRALLLPGAGWLSVSPGVLVTTL